MLSKLLMPAALFVASASSAPATFFSITGLGTSSYKTPTSGSTYSVSFGVSNPNAVSEQGGNFQRGCEINWNIPANPGYSDEPLGPPTCYTRCLNGQGSPYFARITPGGFNSQSNFSLDVLEYYVYRNSALNNATFQVVEGQDEYWCSRGGTTWYCSSTEVTNVAFQSTSSVSPPSNVC